MRNLPATADWKVRRAGGYAACGLSASRACPLSFQTLFHAACGFSEACRAINFAKRLL
ncbi:hypothetical protein [uncultured Bilophila sp.]|uniref:hypothetical protein n=1 Tax=uncultured Bilophila sp. TaxID=529385 RepID=UPI00280B89EE|nr:hypothetical protein [uncultured Bilophila sp.]